MTETNDAGHEARTDADASDDQEDVGTEQVHYDHPSTLWLERAAEFDRLRCRRSDGDGAGDRVFEVEVTEVDG